MTISKPPTLALALLAIGAFWYLSQRRAVAGTVSGAMPYGPTQNALQSGAVQRYGIAPSGITPATPTPLQSVLTFATQLIGGGRTASSGGAGAASSLAQAYSYGGPSSGVYGLDAGIVRAADYQPTYTPDSQGEAAAQAYYLSNPDEFISNPPPILAYSDGSVGSTGGWLDSQ